jgi:hypothetical protein
MEMKTYAQILAAIGGILMPLATLPAMAEDPTPQYAIQTGDDLNRVCANPTGKAITATDHDRLLVCGAYIRGYLGYYSISRSLTQGKSFCLPDTGISAEKLRLLFVGVLDKKPEIRDYPAAVDLASILEAAYPCNSGQPAVRTP